jgi:UDP-N-acetylmuramoyl-L-alanyl-D-glutamate--2,6-diaminopimelate ligase
MAEAGCRYAVMEVSSHSLALSRVAGITFDVGVFTNLTQDHLDFHRNMDDYLSAKAKLFSMCKTGVFNLDDNASKRLIAAAACPVLTFAADEKDADVRAENINLRSDSVTFDAVSSGMTVPIYLGIPGIISVFNALAVIGCARALEIDPFRTANALKTLKGVKGRFETVPTPGCDFTILIDYAHSPDALENVLLTARGFAKGRVVIVFGCGGDRDKTKRPKMGKIASRLSDLAVVTTDNPRTENPEDIIRDILEGMAGSITPCQVIIDRREAIRWVIENAEKDDLIILAGKGHETYQIVGKTRYHMDEREIVSEILGGLAQG